MYEIYQGISHPGCIPAYPGYGYMIRDIYETITSSHLTLQTKQGRIKNFKLSGVTRQVETTGAQLLYNFFGVLLLPGANPETIDPVTMSDTSKYGTLCAHITTPGTYCLSVGNDYVFNINRKLLNGNPAETVSQRLTTPYVFDVTVPGIVAFSVERDTSETDYTDIPIGGGKLPSDFGFMLNAGDTALPWEPYTGATSSPSPEYPQDIQGVGVRTKNLLDEKRMLDFILQKPGASIVQFDGRRCLKLDGAFNFPDFNLYEGFEPDKRYTLTFDGFYEKYKTEAFLGNGFAFTLQNGGRNLSLLDVSDIGTWKHKTTTSDTGVTKLTFTYGVSSVVYIDLDTIQLEEGTISTPYEPYGYRTDVVCRTEDDTESYTAPIYTREPVYDGDSIQLVSGQYCHVQNSMTVDGASVKWVEQATDVTSFDDSYYSHAAVPGVLSAREYSDIKSTHFPKDETIKTANANGTFLYNGLLRARLLGITTLDAFKSWMAEHNPKFLLPRAEPRIDPLPAISQQALRNLPTYKGTTIIDTTDPLEPEITVSYRAQTDYSKLPGLEADYEKGIFTRLGAAKNLTAGAQFNRFPMYAGRRRCNVSDDGTITAYVGEPNYREDGSNGQVMVYQPKFYYQVVPLKLEPQTDGIGYHLRRAQYWVSHKPQPGFKLHPAFKKPAQKLEYIMYSAFEGSIYDTSEAAYILDDAQAMDVAADKLSSIAGAKPASGKTQQFTRSNVEQLAQNRGLGWHGDTIKAESANQLLMAIEQGTMNIQTAIGNGVVSIPDTQSTENNSIVTGGTSNLGSTTGMANGDDGKVSVSYRGMENPWGNIWKQVYGLNIWGDGTKKCGIPYICTDYDFAESKNTGNYESAGFALANERGYVSAMGYSEEYDWLYLPSETLGNSSVPVGDYYYCTPNLNGYRIALLGGSWIGGGIAGVFFWDLSNDVGVRYRSIGSRLIYVPQ